jgi:antitoxin component YwqK of YwqJK toxin-antitoxin module
MKVVLSSLILLVIVVSCKNEYQTKPMRYNRNGEWLSCTGFYESDSLKKVVCFYPNRDTLLIENYQNGELHGPYIRYYENGQIKEKGQYEKNNAEGVWTEYFPNGIRSKYQYYSRDYDYKMIYNKEANKDGKVDSLIYHFEVWTDSEDGKFYIGKEYYLMTELTHSEFDSVKVGGLFGDNPDPKTNNESFTNNGKILTYTFKPHKEGKNIIYGNFFEFNALEPDTLKSFGGNRLFQYEYFAEEFKESVKKPLK